MDELYYKCDTKDCELREWVVFYGKIVPEKPTCGYCKKKYRILEEKA